MFLLVQITLKKIRKNKSLSQKTVATPVFTQAAYSHYENGISDISSSHFLHVIEQLNITLEELKFIAGDYEYPDRDRLIKYFFSLPFNDPQKLNNFIAEVNSYSKNNPSDNFLIEIKSICEALTLLSEGEVEKAQFKVAPVWKRISKYDEYYLEDIKMMNVILYIFPFETSKSMFRILIKNLEKYKGFEEIGQIKFSLIINFSILLIMNAKYHDAEKHLQKLVREDIKSLSYTNLAVCFNRLAIIATYKKIH